MSAISWSNDIRDFLVSYRTYWGASAGLPTYTQTFVNRMTTVFADVAKDSSLILMLDKTERMIIQAFKEAYLDAGLVDDDLIDAALLVKHPEWNGLTAMLGDIIETDINTRIGGHASTPWTSTVCLNMDKTNAQMAAAGINRKDVILGLVTTYLHMVTRNMRYWMGATAAVAGTSPAISAAPEYGNPYTVPY